MTRARSTTFWIYLFLAALALVACWRQNFAFQRAGGYDTVQTFLAFWPALLTNHATTSVTIDIFLFALAANVWMVLDARRHGVPYVWVYVLAAPFIAISVLYPLYLAARERRGIEAEPRMALVEAAALAVLAIPALGLAVWKLVV